MTLPDSTTSGATKLRLTYAGYADHATGQFGQPAPSRPVPITEGVLGFFRRGGPPELVGFHLEHFSTSFDRIDREWLAAVLSEPAVAALQMLRGQVPDELPHLTGLSDDELAAALKASVVRSEAEVPLPSPAQRAIWADLVRAWEEGPESRENRAVRTAAARLRISSALASRGANLSKPFREAAERAAEVILGGVRWPQVFAPPLTASRAGAGELHDRFVWDETGEDPARVEFWEEGDTIWVSGFATPSYGGARTTVTISLTPQAVKAIRPEGEFDPGLRQTVITGTIDHQGWFRLRLGDRISSDRLPNDLIEGVEVAIG
jgi:hypothetical protein